MNDKLLVIAALDTSGGAGITQDTRVAQLHHTGILVCCTGITIQTSAGVESIYPTPPDILKAQIQRMLAAYSVKVIKIGCLCAPEQIDILLEVLPFSPETTIILDPVIKPTKGIEFLPSQVLLCYRKLLNCVDYLTPNLEELAVLSANSVSTWQEALASAQKLSQKYHLTVLVKGGHSSGNRINEAMVTSSQIRTFNKIRRNLTYSHGTGCALSTAFACHLLNNEPPFSAFKSASLWVSRFYCKIL